MILQPAQMVDDEGSFISFAAGSRARLDEAVKGEASMTLFKTSACLQARQMPENVN